MDISSPSYFSHDLHPPPKQFPPLQYLNVSYFSFFTELHRSKRLLTILETLALVAIFLTSVVGNVGAMALLSRKRRLMASKTMLTLNLFVADLLFVSMIPLIVTVRWTVSWRLGHISCRTVLYVICMSGCVTITTLACISVERLQAILRLQTANSLNPRIVCVTLGSIWAVSALTSLPLLLFFQVIKVQSHDKRVMHICTLMWPDPIGEVVWNVAFTVFCFFIPGLVIVLSYTKILQIIKLSKRKFCPQRQPGVTRQDIKLFRTLFILMLAFLIMWSPIFIITFIILARNFQGHLFVSSTIFFWVMTFTLTNSALNPILYSMFQFRHSWRRLFCVTEVVPLKVSSTPSANRQGK
ncbi:hypothetical protein UPYG_G00078870 [Umbra pygmaea]|uniref:G-protein coupled receptors family 1 profile domain-containing protein n=1 Tax=Umbra pygmaea TaxID=75934 RepID=A0ABD0XGR8_UMBPY